jgi:hypothetical protein
VGSVGAAAEPGAVVAWLGAAIAVGASAIAAAVSAAAMQLTVNFTVVLLFGSGDTCIHHVAWVSLCRHR